ncbi:copper homeostasis periplasmic binding protein CopC [Cupriavidus gilardii]|uniref:copper homeostasis periplasmic binding protein CopC n=1 Tax=Cupriavidus gilardii TaxID=82541 RepID=UPI001ABDF080|nr:copper homeostasis periplasmic binding protein CopC [Cupriavidus gilardii]MBO4119280.1 copper homeostasis periplasmic binding protein CopC [Cupriavidus gilardii]
MRAIRTTIHTLLLGAALLSGQSAFAHPKLLSSTPADNAQVSAPERIELRFSESLVKQFSGANLLMTGMPGMANHGPMKIAAAVSPGEDGKTMVVTPAKPLVPGSYRLEWRAVASDTHPVSGKISFQVK